MSEAITLAIKLLLSNKKVQKILAGILIGVFVFVCIIGYIITNLPSLIFGDNGGEQQIQATLSQQQFIDKVAEYSANSYTKYKVFTSIVLAQAILESAWGQSKLASNYNNLFGIKFDPSWTGRTVAMMTGEEVAGTQISIVALFRAYDSFLGSITDHINFFTGNQRYLQNGVFTAKTFEEQAIALQKSGYATDSTYANQLISIIKTYGLQKYDLESYELTEKFAFPSPYARTITSGFGVRKSPTPGASKYHTGIDLSGDNCFNTPVVAALDGIVDTVWNNASGVGNAILLKHSVNNTTWYTKYCHLSNIGVSKNQHVSKGQQIGTVGSTGTSTGAHLHYEVQPNGNPVDPIKYIF
jgi:murein DD-endopeptidase MepM/ murein hydrolase activator NlpD